jgi:hypothetical protein
MKSLWHFAAFVIAAGLIGAYTHWLVAALLVGLLVALEGVDA